MKRILMGLIALALLTSLGAMSTGSVMAKGPKSCEGPDCTTIQSGDLYASTGEQLTTGYDEFGYTTRAACSAAATATPTAWQAATTATSS